ncbi:MAG: hypothetical protein ACRC8S_12020 [Fimbriiglobus sp.]
MSLKAWNHKLRQYDERVPLPEPGTQYWKRLFAQVGVYAGMTHDRAFADACSQYLRLTPPLDDAGMALHRQLGRMTLRVCKDSYDGGEF